VDGSGGIVLVAGAEAQAGDEVFLDYFQTKPLTDARMLAQYGFVPN